MCKYPCVYPYKDPCILNPTPIRCIQHLQRYVLDTPNISWIWTSTKVHISSRVMVPREDEDDHFLAAFLSEVERDDMEKEDKKFALALNERLNEQTEGDRASSSSKGAATGGPWTRKASNTARPEDNISSVDHRMAVDLQAQYDLEASRSQGAATGSRPSTSNAPRHRPPVQGLATATLGRTPSVACQGPLRDPTHRICGGRSTVTGFCLYGCCRLCCTNHNRGMAGVHGPCVGGHAIPLH